MDERYDPWTSAPAFANQPLTGRPSKTRRLVDPALSLRSNQTLPATVSIDHLHHRYLTELLQVFQQITNLDPAGLKTANPPFLAPGVRYAQHLHEAREQVRPLR